MRKIITIMSCVFAISLMISCDKKNNDSVKTLYDSIKIYKKLKERDIRRSGKMKDVKLLLDSLYHHDKEMYELLEFEIKDREQDVFDEIKEREWKFQTNDDIDKHELHR